MDRLRRNGQTAIHAGDFCFKGEPQLLEQKPASITRTQFLLKKKEKYRMFTKALAAVLLLQLHLQTTGASHTHIDKTKIKGLCKVAVQIARTPNVGGKKYRDIKTTAEEAAVAASLTEHAATAETDANTRTVFRAISLGARECAEKANNRLTKLTTAATKAIATGVKTAGHITEIAEFLWQISRITDNSETNFCLGTTAAGRTQATTITDLHCPPEIITDFAPINTLDTAVISPTGFSALTPGQAKITTTHNTKCGLLAGTADTSSSIWHENTPPSKYVMQGLLTLTPHNSAGTETATVITANSGAEHCKFSDANNNGKNIFNALGELLAFKTTSCGQSSESVIKTVVVSKTAHKLLEAVLVTQEPYKTGKTATKAAEEMIKAAADNADTKAEEKILEKIKAQTVTRIEGDKTTTKPLKEAVSSDDERCTLLLNHSQNRKELDKLVAELEAANSRPGKVSHVHKPDDCKGKWEKLAKKATKKLEKTEKISA
uniref:Variant surface glycoprotein 1125.2505 n=1 Tax=Trypanosoma brucei TaxID=5691 RepID=A0A1J0R892_9TRYP|nr:variant surface glycoprotein 1125.2505 [Trypanosoma brucei]